MDPANPKDIKNTPDSPNTITSNPEELLAFGREAPLTRREIVKDLAPIQGDENEGIYLGTNQQATDRQANPNEEMDPAVDQPVDQQQDGNYFNFFKTKLLQLDEGQENEQQQQPSSSNPQTAGLVDKHDKGQLGKTDVIASQQPINPGLYNTGDIEIISNNDKTALKSQEISPTGKLPNSNNNINNVKNDILFMVPNAMNSQLQSCLSSSPESRDAFTFSPAPAKLSIFQQKNNNNNANSPNHPAVTEFDANSKEHSNGNNTTKQTGNIPTKKSLLFLQKAQGPQQSPSHGKANSTWMLDQIKHGGLWGIKSSKIIIISCIISAIIGIACFYASDPHSYQAILVVVMYPVYGVLFQILLISLQRAHILSSQLISQQQKDTNAFTKMLIAANSINLEMNKYLKIKVFLFIYKPVLVWVFILAIIISMLYGLIVEIGIVNRINDGAIEQRELIVIQTVLRLFLTVFLVLLNSLVISVIKYSVENQAKKDHTQIQSNNYLGSVYKEFEAEMARLQNNLHIGLSNAINATPTQNHTASKEQDDTDMKNKIVEDNNWLQSNDTEHNQGQIIHTGVVNSAKKLVTEDGIIEQSDNINKHVAAAEKDKTPKKDKSFSKGFTMTEESHKKRQEILLTTPFKDKSVTWNDKNFPPPSMTRNMQKSNGETQESQQEGKQSIMAQHKQKQSKKSISSRIHLFFTTPEKQPKDGKRQSVLAETNNNSNNNAKDTRIIAGNNTDNNGNGLVSQPNGVTLPTEFAKSETTAPASAGNGNGALLKSSRSQLGVSTSSVLLRSQHLDELAFENRSKVAVSKYEITEFWSKISSDEILRLTANSLKLVCSVIFSHFIGLSVIANYTLHDHEIGFYFASLGLYVFSVILTKLNAPAERITMKNNPPKSHINQYQQQQQLRQQTNGIELLLELSNLPFRASIIVACVGCNAISYSLGQSTRAAWILMGIRILLIIAVFIIPAEFMQFRLKKAHQKYLQRVSEAALASHKLTEEDHNNLEHNNSRTLKNKILLKIQTKSSPSPANSPLRHPNANGNSNRPSDASTPQKYPQTKEGGSQQLISDSNNNNNPISIDTPFGINAFTNTAVIPNSNLGNIPQTSLRTIAMFRTQRAQDLLAQHDKSQMDSQIHNVAVTREQNIHNLIIFCIAQGAAFVAFIVVTFIAKHDGLYHFRSLIGGKVQSDMDVLLPGQFDGNYSNVYLVLLIEMLSMLAVLLLGVVSFHRSSIEQAPSFWDFLAINLRQAAFSLVIAFCFAQQLLYVLFNN